MSTDVSHVTASGPGATFDPEARWRVHPQVAVRPEPFGALLYHFGTRRLTFLKDRRLLTVISTIDSHGSAREACAAAGVAPNEQPAFDAALQRLVDVEMLTLVETEVLSR